MTLLLRASALFVVFFAGLFGCRAYDHDLYARLADGAVPDEVDVTPGADGSCANGLTPCSDRCVDTQTDSSSCGGCGIACPGVLNARAVCTAGVCTSVCATGFHACAGACVADDALATCGASCSPCPVPANATARCDGTACRFDCTAAFADCNGVPGDGCEADLSSAVSCGTCRVVCSDPTPLCSTGGGCTSGCTGGQVQCGGSCVDIDDDATHCGGCNPCPGRLGTGATCLHGACTYACLTGRADCDHAIDTDGCEIDTMNDVANCGRCGNACATPTHGTATCVSGACSVTCAAGYVAVGTSCLDFGGLSDEDTGSPCPTGLCIASNPVTGACSCPRGFVTFALSSQSYCAGSTTPALFDFCQPGTLSDTGSWAGAYLRVSAGSPCDASDCLAINPYTGACTCPPGTTAITMRGRKTPGSCPDPVDTDLVVCGRTSAVGAFQGAYQTFDDATASPHCIASNPWTRACSCPAGARVVAIPANATPTMPTTTQLSHYGFCLAP